MEVLNNLKKYRQARGFSQQRLADKADCARSYISEVENGSQRLTLKMATRFGEILNVAPFDLLGADAIKYRGSFAESLQALVLGSFEQFVQDTVDHNVDDYSCDLFWMLFPIFNKKFSEADIKVLRAMVESMGEKYADR